MRFTVNSDLMKSPCRVLILSSQKHYPVVMTAIKQGGNDYITVEGIDTGIMEFCASISAVVEEPGEAGFPAGEFVKFEQTAGEVAVSMKVRRIPKPKAKPMEDPDAPVETPLEPESGPKTTGDLHIKDNDNTKHKIELISNYHKLTPKGQPIGTVTMELSTIQYLLEKVSFASAKDNNLFRCGCVKLDFMVDRIRAIAADGRIAAVAIAQRSCPHQGSFLLARAAVRTIINMRGQSVTLSFYPRGIGVAIEGDVMYDLYIPEYTEMFPDVLRWFDKVSPNSTLRGPRDEFIKALNRIQYGGDKAYIILKRQGGYEKMPPRFLAREVSLSEYSSDLLQWDGDDLSIKVNRDTLLEVIKRASEEVIITFTNDLTPFKVESSDGNYVCGMTPYNPGEKR